MNHPAHSVQTALMPYPAHDRILVLCCRDQLDEERGRLLTETVRSDPDWHRLLRKATYHRLLGLIRYHLNQVDLLFAAPVHVGEHLQRHDTELAAARDRQRKTLTSCLDAFVTDDIEFILLKGPVLQELYPVGVFRPSGDIDFLVRERKLGRVRAALESAGFRSGTRAPFELSELEAIEFAQYFEQFRFLREHFTEVELHFRLYNYGVPDPVEEVWQRKREQVIDGRPVSGLSLEDQFLYLVTHLNLHAFGRMLWYYDVAAFYWKWKDSIHWEALADRARARGIGSSFYHSLTWILQLLHPERPLPDLDALKPSALRRRLFSMAWRKRDFVALRSYIRPFDAAMYYLLACATPFRNKLRYLVRVLFPPLSWVAAHLDADPSIGLIWRYLRKRRRERRDWNRVTRKDELLG